MTTSWPGIPTARRATQICALLALTAPLTGCGSGGASRSQGIPAALLAQSRPIGTGPRFQLAVRGPVIKPCTAALGPRYAAHVEVFAADRVLLVPAGIGTGAPRRGSAGRIAHARCYGALVTLDPTGVVFIRQGQAPTLGDLFRSWGQPLASVRLGPFRSHPAHPVVAFVNGRRWPGRPWQVPLRPHAEVVVEIGPYVPPHHSYVFPSGT